MLITSPFPTHASRGTRGMLLYRREPKIESVKLKKTGEISRRQGRSSRWRSIPWRMAAEAEELMTVSRIILVVIGWLMLTGGCRGGEGLYSLDKIDSM